MIIHAHILARDESEIFLYAARHYRSFCQSVTLHDMGSTDGTLEIAANFGIKVRTWDSGDKVDDRVNTLIKNTCWIGDLADWIMVVDADEILYFPSGVEKSLTSYSQQKLPIVKPRGWEMTSATMPTTDGQIYDEIKMGARDDKWYSKSVLFTPHLVESISFAPGAHQVSAKLKDGTTFPNPVEFSTPEFYLLHYHQIGSVERIAAKYDRTRQRMCDNNVKMNWGNVHESGIDHASKKRNAILSRLERVIR